MPRPLRQTKPSSKDIDDIWDYTARTYDIEQANAYMGLLDQAFRDIEKDPDGPTSQEHPELGPRVRSYRIELSKERSGADIKSPRHIVFYTLEYEAEIVVLRVLHDRMDPTLHLPEE